MHDLSIPKISIVIPVYNVASYLSKCLDSIISQTLHDIEIILVDDGSTDGSGGIVDEYASWDKRIKVFHTENHGLSAARNLGIDFSSAEWILFVDSDDWIEPDLCEKTLLTATVHFVDLVLYAYTRIYTDRVIPTNPSFLTGLLTQEEALFFNTHFAPAVWLGLYRRELFSTIRFPDGKIHEDYGTTHRLIHAAKSIFILNENLYNYRIDRPGSIETEEVTRKHPDLKEMMLRRINDLSDWGYEDLVCNDAMSLLIRYGYGGQKRLVDIVIKGSANYSLKRKMMAMLLRVSPTLFDAACIVARKRIEWQSL